MSGVKTLNTEGFSNCLLLDSGYFEELRVKVRTPEFHSIQEISGNFPGGPGVKNLPASAEDTGS